MADITLLQQEVILLKLRIAKLEDDKKKMAETIQQLKNELIDALGSQEQYDTSTEEEDTPSATSICEDN
jgi:chaperonin cofactor prefoldin